MNKLNLSLISLSVLGILAITTSFTGCSSKTKEECQNDYNLKKETALNSYEQCSKEKCDGKLIMEQGKDKCTTECFENLKNARTELDTTLEKCMSSASN